MEARIPDKSFCAAADQVSPQAMRRGMGILGLGEHGEQELRRWSADRMCAHWRILPCEQELRVRRLR
eukprot:1692243-Pyramimonas_sp.AAC.1